MPITATTSMQEAANLKLAGWETSRTQSHPPRVLIFASLMSLCIGLSALMSSVIPLQFSIVTVFLFAGPHNWFELRYFLMRLPIRFGRSRNFFITAFAGIGLLTATYIAMPVMSAMGWLGADSWSTALASWNTLLLTWVGILVWQRGRQKRQSDWFW